VEFG
jgi:hypothetical protein